MLWVDFALAIPVLCLWKCKRAGTLREENSEENALGSRAEPLVVKNSSSSHKLILGNAAWRCDSINNLCP